MLHTYLLIDCCLSCTIVSSSFRDSRFCKIFPPCSVLSYSLYNVHLKCRSIDCNLLVYPTLLQPLLHVYLDRWSWRSTSNYFTQFRWTVVVLPELPVRPRDPSHDFFRASTCAARCYRSDIVASILRGPPCTHKTHQFELVFFEGTKGRAVNL